MVSETRSVVLRRAERTMRRPKYLERHHALRLSHIPSNNLLRWSSWIEVVDIHSELYES